MQLPALTRLAVEYNHTVALRGHQHFYSESDKTADGGFAGDFVDLLFMADDAIPVHADAKLASYPDASVGVFIETMYVWSVVAYVNVLESLVLRVKTDDAFVLHAHPHSSGFVHHHASGV